MGRGLPAPAPTEAERPEALLRGKSRRIARPELLPAALTIIVLILHVRGITRIGLRRERPLARQPFLARLGLGDLGLALGRFCRALVGRLDSDHGARVARGGRL